MEINHHAPRVHPTSLPTFIQTQVPLADKNWFATGGKARYFSEPKDTAQFQHALAFANAHSLPIFVLGQGANILISDEGFDGLVIRPALCTISTVDVADGRVLLTAGSGVTMHDLITYCLDHCIVGLEEFSGIPGTVGGSVYINLHYFNFLLAQFVVHAHIIDKKTGEISTVDNNWFNFGYDQSALHTEDHYLLNATFALTRCTELQAAYARGRHVEIIRHRAARYPTKNTCGSFFRNFHPHEVTLESNGKKMIYAAYYLDKVGVKGTLSVGGATVSYQHANMLVNTGTATSSDIVSLVRTMQELVHKTFGIIPQPECRLVGFKEYPLL